ncbi:hypothetical protein V8F06_005068 [Rhypophila decipiens]
MVVLDMKLLALVVGCLQTTSVQASPLFSADTAETTRSSRWKPRSFIPYTTNSLRCRRDDVVWSGDVIEAVSMLGDRPGRPQLEPDCDGHGRTCQQVSCHNDNAVVLCASKPEELNVDSYSTIGSIALFIGKMCSAVTSGERTTYGWDRGGFAYMDGDKWGVALTNQTCIDWIPTYDQPSLKGLNSCS